jgi:uncharacterized protein YecA (UPF0149 family)
MTKLGSDKRSVVASVQTMEKAEEIISLCNERGWEVTVGIEPDKLEDISDVERLPNAPTEKSDKAKVGKNDPCPCGGGLEFRKYRLKK